MKGASTMEYSTAREVYQKLNAVTRGDEDAEMLYRDLVNLAVSYARRRTDWQLVDIEARIRMDEARTIAHDAFIGSCNSLARYLGRIDRDTSWRDMLTEDRKEIGDFACYIHAMLGVEAR
jgi:hypothetical protein